jgi:hypothetical protein
MTLLYHASGVGSEWVTQATRVCLLASVGSTLSMGGSCLRQCWNHHHSPLMWLLFCMWQRALRHGVCVCKHVCATWQVPLHGA